MATVEKRGKNTYRFRVYIGEDCNGKAIYQSKTYTAKASESTPKKLKKELDNASASFETEVLNGEYHDEKITLNKFYKTWTETYSRALSPAERELNEDVMKRVFLPALGHLPLVRIKGHNIQGVINGLVDRGLKPKTISKYFSAFSTVMTRAYKLDLIQDNPCKRVTLPRNERDGKIHTFTASEGVRFLQAVENGVQIVHPEITRKNGRVIPQWTEHREYPFQFLVFFRLAIYSGARRGELIGLRWNNVDFENRRIIIDHATSFAKSEGGQFDKSPKTKSSIRNISMDHESMVLLRHLKEQEVKLCHDLGTAWEGPEDIEEAFVFITSTGGQMHLDTPNHKFSEILTAYNASVSEEEKLPALHLHDLRHTSATVQISAGVPVTVVAKRMGHADISTTLRNYVHPEEEDDRAINALSTAFEIAKSADSMEKATTKNWENFGRVNSENYPKSVKSRETSNLS